MLFYKSLSSVISSRGYSLHLWADRRAIFSRYSLAKCHRNYPLMQAHRWFASLDNDNGESGARPLYFQQSPTGGILNRESSSSSSSSSSVPLTPYDFLGTAAALSPHARHLAPCLGAALATSPLAGNLMRLGQRQPNDLLVLEQEHANQNPMDQNWANLLSRTGFLANNLFFQLIRESPIHLVRNKSMPAAYLTPEIIGCFLGHHHHQQQQQQQMTKRKKQKNNNDPNNAMLKTQLRQDFGIKSNHIHETKWTGMSLARWMDLVIPWDQDTASNEISYAMCQQSLVSALWLIALWGTGPSKDSLRGYYEALERADGAYSPNQTSLATQATLDHFSKNDFCPKKVEASMNRLIEYYSSLDEQSDASKSSSSNDSVTARDFELVCAAIVLQQQPQDGVRPPLVPNGYFTFDDGDIKADCAEVVVREILTMLLWDESNGTMDISRLAPTASQKLVDVLYRFHDLQEANPLKEKINGATEQDDEEQELGQAWFDLLSNLPHCDYLAVSPNGKAFELAPTSESIAKALWHLLEGGDQNDEGATGKQPWTSLHEMANFWSETQPTDSLVVTHDRLKHQSPDGVSMEHEIITLHFRNKVIEVRLRCDFEKASGMAAVTHLMKPKKEQLISLDQVEKLQEICLNHQIFDPSLVMLCLALQSMFDNVLPSVAKVNKNRNFLAVFESLWWLATPYGADRRELMAVKHTDDLFEYNCKVLATSQNLLRERILRACRICETHPHSGAHLLSWILQESPVVVESSSTLSDDSIDSFIEKALLSLPTSILDNDSLLEAIECNWACLDRGRLLVRAIRWNLGKVSLWRLFSQSKIHEMIDLVSLSRLIRERGRPSEK